MLLGQLAPHTHTFGGRPWDRSSGTSTTVYSQWRERGRVRDRRLVVPLSGQQPDHAAPSGARTTDDLRDRRKRRARRRACARIMARELPQMLAQFPSIRLVSHQRGRQRFRGDRRSRRPDPGARLQRRDLGRRVLSGGTARRCFRCGRRRLSVLSPRWPPARTDVAILVHNYDYAIPDGRTLPGMRSWLKLPMDNDQVPIAGAPYGGIRREIVRALIDQLTRAPVATSRRDIQRPRTAGRRSRVVGRHARRRRMGKRAASEIRRLRAARRRLLERPREGRAGPELKLRVEAIQHLLVASEKRGRPP